MSMPIRVGDMEAYQTTCPNERCTNNGTAFVRDDLFEHDDADALCPECATPLTLNRPGDELSVCLRHSGSLVVGLDKPSEMR